MTVLIFFATIEGQTGKIARFVADQARKAGHETLLVDAADNTAEISFKGVDKVILAASVHERRHPSTFEVFLTAQRKALEALDTLLLSVSLKAAFPEGLEEAQDYVTEMNMRTGFTPDTQALVAGAVRTGSYDYFASQVVQHVVLRGQDADVNAGDQEFTDWAALEATVAGFLAG